MTEIRDHDPSEEREYGRIHPWYVLYPDLEMELIMIAQGQEALAKAGVQPITPVTVLWGPDVRGGHEDLPDRRSIAWYCERALPPPRD